MQNLQELICTKINHDIIGHVGAVCNAVELLEEDDMEFIDDIKNILKISSFALAARLKFFRIAFGMNNASVDNIQDIISNYTTSIASKNYPINTHTTSITKENLKSILLIVMILSEIIYKGGNINIEESTIKVEAQTFNQEKFNNLKDIKNAEQTPSNAQYFYLSNILNEANKKLLITQTSEHNITIEVQ